MTNVLDREMFESAYAGQAPWDIGKPNKVFVDMADRITGSVLDAGCGTGENALLFAGRGCRVTGIDFVAKAINCARRKAFERGLTVTFLVKDALTLKDWRQSGSTTSSRAASSTSFRMRTAAITSKGWRLC